MSFKDFLNSAWSDHASQALEVSLRFSDGIGLIEKNDQIPLLANLMTHVMGEHLGEWQKGIGYLEQLRHVSFFDPQSESENAIVRSIVSLEVASGAMHSLQSLSSPNQIRVLAIAASALSERNTAQALELFQMSLDRANDGLPKEDPANRALAVTGNNLASALEGKSARTPAEAKLMILAAQTGRRYWEVAGTWLEVERAEYRLSQTYLKAGENEKSKIHALKCIEGAKQNQAGPLELFFGFEALALAEKAIQNRSEFSKAVSEAQRFYDQLSNEEKPWCENAMTKLKI